MFRCPYCDYGGAPSSTLLSDFWPAGGTGPLVCPNCFARIQPSQLLCNDEHEGGHPPGREG